MRKQERRAWICLVIALVLFAGVGVFTYRFIKDGSRWAGFYGNVLGSALGMLLFGLLGNRWLGYEPNWPGLLCLGVAANLCGQLGDLSTSLIKREVGIKDYSRLFLTHGGMLDRFDSTLFIAPVVYYFVNMGLI